MSAAITDLQVEIVEETPIHIVLKETGPQGNTGEGVAAGGVSGQILTKQSSTDYDAEWVDAPVKRVNGYAGDVVLSKSDIDLGNVDNTSDANKPISTAAQTALDAKANSAHSHAISDTTGLQAALDSKAPQSTTYTKTEVDTALSGKAATSHTHTKAQVTDFAHTHPVAEVTGLQTALDTKANASDTVNLTGDQTVAGVKTFSSAPIAPSGTSIGGVLYLTGTGFPEGVVTAPVGSIYIDTAVTNGASSWIKKSGTGNTGWQVLEGDTGWRNITALWQTNSNNGFDAAGLLIKLRRVNNVVTLSVYGKIATGAVQSLLTFGGAEMAPPQNGELQLLALGGAKALRGDTLNNGWRAELAQFGASYWVRDIKTWTPHSTAWPTNLPGTAV